MKIRKLYITIGLVGILTTSCPSATSAMTLDQSPVTAEKDQRTSQEQMAHKMMLFKEAFPKEGKDIVHGEIGPTLHEVNQLTTFTCPTVEELQHVVLKNTGKRSFHDEIKEFESNGIYFTTTVLPPANSKFDSISVAFKGPEKAITRITCRYVADDGVSRVNYPVGVNLDKSQLNESKVTFSQNDMKHSIGGEMNKSNGTEYIFFNENIEFTVQPLIKK